ncbi:MAG: 2-amino-4-hydroxy-6-hydroxymethyldihydropteridine diphosphokinase [Planctomycetales bacterium]|nr:2-amino-4-hydroxy-6-hydroxymethyldihydropteridine diphosphokinase [Planctomycetales bacterium]
MAVALLSVGANLGQRRATIDQAVAALQRQPGVRLLRHSRWLETKPIGGPPDQPSFLNGAILIDTSLDPPALLAALLEVEKSLGRERHARWGARCIDLDILLYDDVIVHQAQLDIPHPRMAFRYFNLSPAAEIASDLVHPEIGWSIGKLFDHLRSSDYFVALAGPLGGPQHDLAVRCARAGNAQFVADPVAPTAEFTRLGDRSGPSSALPIEFQRARFEALQRDQFASAIASGQAVLSDFWLPESLAAGHAEEGSAAEGEGSAARNCGLLVPRLIVLLDEPWEAARGRLFDLANPDADLPGEDEWSAHRHNLLQFVRRAANSPVFDLTKEPHESAFTEIVAALDAMRCE